MTIRAACALYTFKGKNNDELNLKKGDVLIITQALPDGWWEGTCGGKTGWFPSNYVQEVAADAEVMAKLGTTAVAANNRDSAARYYHDVLEVFVESEEEYSAELTAAVEKFCAATQTNMTAESGKTLWGNYVEVHKAQVDFVKRFAEAIKKPLAQHRVGGLFLDCAATLSPLYLEYASRHPLAVVTLDQHRKEIESYVEGDNLMELTTALSLPLRHIDSYSSTLKELDRHTTDSSPDKGDVARAVCVYQQLSADCSDRRRARQMELELAAAVISQWPDNQPQLSQLGDLAHMSHVKVVTPPASAEDRLFVLLPNHLLILGLGTEQSSYIFKSLLDVASLSVENDLSVDPPAHLHSFHLSSSTPDDALSCTVVSASALLKQRWLQSFTAAGMPVKLIQPSTPRVSNGSPALLSNGQTQGHQSRVGTPQHISSPQHVTNGFKQSFLTAPKARGFSLSDLRPLPPQQCFPAQETLPASRKLSSSGRHKKPEDLRRTEEDQTLLSTVDAYAAIPHSRLPAPSHHAINNSNQPIFGATIPLRDLRRDDGTLRRVRESTIKGLQPQILVAEQEKIMLEDETGGFSEKSLVDTIYHLHDTVTDLRREMKSVRKELEVERRSRKRLETMLTAEG